MTVAALVEKLRTLLINPAILLLFAVALLLFAYGLVEYLYQLNVGGKDDKAGRQHMLWGVIGMFIMVAAYGILKLIDSTIGSNLVK